MTISPRRTAWVIRFASATPLPDWVVPTSRVPVVSTDAPHGPREILAGGRYGPLVPVGDAEALAAAMAATLDQPIARHVLEARAADFAVDVIGDKYEALVA